MTFEEKYKIFNDEYALYPLSLKQQEDLFNLVGSVYLSNKIKNPDVTIDQIAYKLVKDAVNEHSAEYLSTVIGIHTLSHIDYNCLKPHTLGLKNITDIKQYIADILHNWLPF